MKSLVQVIRDCRSKGIGVAISRPCFELWLLLHFAEFPQNSSVSCDELAEEIKKGVGAYNKRKAYNLPITNEGVEKAIVRSKARQTDSGEIPGQMETRIHRIIEELVKMKIISIEN